MMVEYIDTIANCVMALLAVVAFIVAFSEYCLHKRELIDVYLERSIACCQKMLEHSSRFWGYAPIFCGNAELAAARNIRNRYWAIIQHWIVQLNRISRITAFEVFFESLKRYATVLICFRPKLINRVKNDSAYFYFTDYK